MPPITTTHTPPKPLSHLQGRVDLPLGRGRLGHVCHIAPLLAPALRIRVVALRPRLGLALKKERRKRRRGEGGEKHKQRAAGEERGEKGERAKERTSLDFECISIYVPSTQRRTTETHHGLLIGGHSMFVHPRQPHHCFRLVPLRPCWYNPKATPSHARTPSHVFTSRYLLSRSLAPSSEFSLSLSLSFSVSLAMPPPHVPPSTSPSRCRGARAADPSPASRP